MCGGLGRGVKKRTKLLKGTNHEDTADARLPQDRTNDQMCEQSFAKGRFSQLEKERQAKHAGVAQSRLDPENETERRS